MTDDAAETGAPSAGDSQPPVCLQTMWRTCGTYFYSKFKRQPKFCAYLEPCSEFLMRSSPDDLQARFPHLRHHLRNADFGSTAGEFPFAAAGAAQYFRKRFSYEPYYMAPDIVDAELTRYVSCLFDHARRQGRIPVAKFCRWGLRTAWLIRTFRPVIVYVARDPDTMFRSYWSFGGRNSYFVFALLMIVGKNREEVLFQETADVLDIPRIHGDTVREEMAQAWRAAQRCDVQTLRDVLLILWAVTLKHNAAMSTLLIDSDLLADNDVYRRRVEEQFTALIGEPTSFGDFESRRQPAAPGVALSARGAALARRALGQVLPDCGWSNVACGAASARILSALI